MNIIKLNATDSTNTYLKHLARQTSLPDGTVVVAKNQTKGRGQVGNLWSSQEGLSLTFSLFKRFDQLPVHRQFAVSMAVSLAILNTLKSLPIRLLSLKWPNDIMADDKKLGGILIENVLEGDRIKYSVIGIGLNVNQSRSHLSHLPRASSLALASGIEYDLDKMFQNLLQHLLEKLKSAEGPDFSLLKQEYESNLFRKNVQAVYRTSQGQRVGKISGISESGELIIVWPDGTTGKFQLQEVQFVY